MPIPVGSNGLPVPPPPTNAPPVIGNAEARWIDPTGVVWPLTDRRYGYWMTDGATGLGAPTRDLVVDRKPRGGGTVRKVLTREKLLTLPLYVYGLTHMDFITNWRGLIDAFDMTSDSDGGAPSVPGVYQITRPDGTTRQRACFYQEGFDGTNGRGLTWDAAAITLLSEAPYWESPDEVTITRKYVASGGGSVFAPWPHISNSRTLGDTIVTNPGEVHVWPAITWTGPGSALTATRHNRDGSTSAYTLTAVGGPLGDGEQATIAGDPPEILGPDGSSWNSGLSWPGADLWSLPRGDTKVTFDITDPGPGASVRLAFKKLWRAA